jgi:hypothetical protein
MNERIKWQPELDSHVKGKSEQAETWLRLGRDGKVLGIYLMLKTGVEKLVPQPGVEETQAGAKLLAEKRLAEIELWKELS